jgi:TolB protein
MNGFFRTLMLVGALASGMAALAVLPARALVEIDVNKGNIEPLPIALPDFVSAMASAPRSRRSSLPTCSGRACSRPSTRAPSSRRSATRTQAPRFEDWKVINAQALVTGRVSQEGGRPPARRVPPVGHLRRRAADRRAVLRQQGQTRAASPTSSPTRSTSG